jgi:hypothetical protein
MLSIGAGETASQSRSALAGPIVNNPLWGLFKALQATLDYLHLAKRVIEAVVFPAPDFAKE